MGRLTERVVCQDCGTDLGEWLPINAERVLQRHRDDGFRRKCEVKNDG